MNSITVTDIYKGYLRKTGQIHSNEAVDRFAQSGYALYYKQTNMYFIGSQEQGTQKFILYTFDIREANVQLVWSKKLKVYAFVALKDIGGGTDLVAYIPPSARIPATKLQELRDLQL